MCSFNVLTNSKKFTFSGNRYMLICNVIYDISRLYAAAFLFIGICKRNRQYLIPIHIVVCIWILFTSYDILGVLFNYFFNDGFSSETWNHDFRLDMTELIMQLCKFIISGTIYFLHNIFILVTQLALRSVLSYLSKFYLKLQNRKSSLPVPVTTSTEK